MSGEERTILIVEDEGLVARDLGARLIHLGLGRPEVVNSGEAAIRRCAELEPDLVLMDIQLKRGIDGIEAAGIIRARHHLPIIYLTAHADHETLERAKHTEPLGYVVKPFEERALQVTIELALYRHAAEQARQRLDASFRTLISRIPEAVLVHRDERVLFANEAAGALIGEEPLVGRPVREALRLLGPGSFEPGVPSETRMQGADGTPRMVELSTFAVEFDGAPAWGTAVRDLTEQRQLQAQQALADRMASLGLLAAGVAHEISNPLTYAMHNLDSITLEARRLPGPIASGILEPAHKAVDGLNRVRRIVRDLKNYSRAPDDGLTSTSVQEALESASSMAYNALRYRARVVREFARTPPVAVSESRLSQVFLNLLINAAQALPEGRVDENEVTLRTYAEGPEVVVEIRDTGPGIAAEELPRLFDPFFTTKPAGVGSGLGLSICQSIVTSHGGRIEVESQPGRGACFRVRLPATSEPAAVEAPRERCYPTPGRAARILIVDDEPNIGLGLEVLLRREHTVALAFSGVEARKLLESGSVFDCVLCDLMMPGMSGMELHAWVEARDSGLARRMIFMTGGAFTEGAKAFLARVGNRRLEKPFGFDRLSIEIQELLADVPESTKGETGS